MQYYLLYKPFQVLSQFTSPDGKMCLKDIIEVETSDNINADKVLIRIPYNEKYDICLEFLKKAEILSEKLPNFRSVTLNNLACFYRR